MIFGWVGAVLCLSGVQDSGGDRRHADVDGGGGVGAPVNLGEFVAGAGQADLESFGFAVPAFAFGFGDAGDQVVVDLGDAGPLGGRGPVHAAPQAAVLVNARGPERAAAGAGGDLAEFEMAEELGPFFVGGGPAFLAGPQGAAPGQECQVGLDCLVGVNGLVSHGHVQVLVAGDDLGDVRGQAAHDGVGDEDPRK